MKKPVVTPMKTTSGTAKISSLATGAKTPKVAPTPTKTCHPKR